VKGDNRLPVYEARLVFSDKGQLFWMPFPRGTDPLVSFVAGQLDSENNKLAERVKLLLDQSIQERGEDAVWDRQKAVESLQEWLGKNVYIELIGRYPRSVISFYGVLPTCQFQLTDFAGKPLIPIECYSELRWIERRSEEYLKSSETFYQQALDQVVQILQEEDVAVGPKLVNAIAFSRTLHPQKELLYLQLTTTPENLKWLQDSDEDFAYRLGNCYVLPELRKHTLSFKSLDQDGSINSVNRTQWLANSIVRKIELLGNEGFADFLELSPDQEAEVGQLGEEIRNERRRLWRTIVNAHFSPNPATKEDFELYDRQQEKFCDRFLEVAKDYEKQVERILIKYQIDRWEMISVRDEIRKLGLVTTLLYGSLSKSELINDQIETRIKKRVKKIASDLEMDIAADSREITQQLNDRLGKIKKLQEMGYSFDLENRSPWLILNSHLF